MQEDRNGGDLNEMREMYGTLHNYLAESGVLLTAAAAVGQPAVNAAVRALSAGKPLLAWLRASREF